MNWQHADPMPALLVVPAAADSLDEAHAAIELWEHYSRKTLDSSQRLVVEVIMARQSSGLWAASTTGRAMPRQNGKGDEIEVVELWGLVQLAEAILHTVHDAALLAGQAQARLLGVLEGHADLRRLIRKRWLGVGQQMVELRNGGTIWYRTRTKGGGRGLDDVDRVVVDEAQLATVEHVGAVTPTLFANPNPQLNVLGSAGIHGSSAWWWSLRRRALAGDGDGFAFVEHTAERPALEDGRVVSPEVDVTDRSLWPGANPAIAAGRGSGMDFLDTQLTVMGPAMFGREHLGVWDAEPTLDGYGLVPPDVWAACARDAERSDRVAYAVDASPDGRSAAIGVSDGTVILVADHDIGTTWVSGRLSALLAERPGPVFIDPKGPAGALLVDLKEAGVEVTHVSPQEHAQACGGLLAAITDEPIRVHHSNQPALNAALAGATRRVYGDAWAWNRRTAHVDISPLVAVTLARWGALTMPTYEGPLVAVT